MTSRVMARVRVRFVTYNTNSFSGKGGNLADLSLSDESEDALIEAAKSSSNLECLT